MYTSLFLGLQHMSDRSATINPFNAEAAFVKSAHKDAKIF